MGNKRGELWKDPGLRGDFIAIINHVENIRLMLDAGCGPSRVSALVSRLKKCEVVGVDINRDAIKLAEMMHRDMGTKFCGLVSDVRFLPFREGVFDLVYAGGTVEHVNQTLLTLKEFNRVTKRFAIITVPNFFSLHFFYQKIGCKIGRSHHEKFLRPKH